MIWVYQNWKQNSLKNDIEGIVQCMLQITRRAFEFIFSNWIWLNAYIKESILLEVRVYFAFETFYLGVDTWLLPPTLVIVLPQPPFFITCLNSLRPFGFGYLYSFVSSFPPVQSQAHMKNAVAETLSAPDFGTWRNSSWAETSSIMWTGVRCEMFQSNP